MGALESKLQKLRISRNEILRMTILPVFSQFLWNLKFIFRGSHRKLSLMLLQITNYIYSPWAKSVKKNVIKIFWYKVFVHWKLKLLNFLMDSVFKIFTVCAVDGIWLVNPFHFLFKKDKKLKLLGICGGELKRIWGIWGKGFNGLETGLILYKKYSLVLHVVLHA